MKQVVKMLGRAISFNSCIRFHNLKPIEIGALLSILTFHNNLDCYHNIGFGKPFGYGKVKMKATLLNSQEGRENEYMKIYETAMDSFMKGKNLGKWLESEQIKELFSMAKGIPNGYAKEFDYLKMSTERGSNEFLLVKNNGEELRRFTDITNQNIEIKSLKDWVQTEIVSNKKEIVVLQSQEIIPTKLKTGDLCTANYVGNKKVQLTNCNESDKYDIQCVFPKGYNFKKNSIKVKIKQISNAGKICQVEYVG